MPLKSIGADILLMISYGLNIFCFTEKLGSYLFIYLFRNIKWFLNWHHGPKCAQICLLEEKETMTPIFLRWGNIL